MPYPIAPKIRRKITLIISCFVLRLSINSILSNLNKKRRAHSPYNVELSFFYFVKSPIQEAKAIKNITNEKIEREESPIADALLISATEAQLESRNIRAKPITNRKSVSLSKNL
jgi:hypothetical protein